MVSVASTIHFGIFCKTVDLIEFRSIKAVLLFPSTKFFIGNSSKGMDLKGEITKFLEELIDKHPETLDAIESVRMNRLGRGLNSANSCLRSHPPTLIQPRLVLFHIRFFLSYAFFILLTLLINIKNVV